MNVGLIDPQATPQNNNFGIGNIPTAQDYEDLRVGQQSFSQMAAYLSGSTVNVSYKNNPQRYTDHFGYDADLLFDNCTRCQIFCDLKFKIDVAATGLEGFVLGFTSGVFDVAGGFDHLPINSASPDQTAEIVSGKWAKDAAPTSDDRSAAASGSSCPPHALPAPTRERARPKIDCRR